MKQKKGMIVWAAVCLTAAVLFFQGKAGAQAATSEDGRYAYELDTAGNAVLTAYYGQETEVAVPATVGGITVSGLQGTFQNNEKLQRVFLPASVTTVDETAFVGCKSLQGFTVDALNTSLYSDEDGVLYNRDRTVLLRYPVGRHLSSGTYTIPSTVAIVAGCAFEGYNTQNIVIPSNVTVIGDYAFANAGNFNEVTSWEEGTQIIGSGAFYGCTNLKVSLPSSVNTIGSYAFAYCSNIQIDISRCTITELADCLFYECDNLHQLVLPQTVVTVGAYAFAGCDNLNEVTLADSVRTIREGAFYQCQNLHSIEIPDGVTAIENNTFAGCQNLNTVILPDTLTTIGDNAFANCQNIHSINIPENVTYISNTSFAGVDTSKINMTYKVKKTKLRKAKRMGKKKVKLTWKKVDGADGYIVYRSTKKNKGYKAVGTLKNKSSFVDKKVRKGKKYYYKIRVFKKVQGKKYTSAFSNRKRT